MSEYERIVAAYDKDPKCRNYDFSVARAHIAELEAALAELDKALDDLYFFLKPGDTVTVRTPGKRGSVTFAMDRLADLRARAEEGRTP